MCYVVVILCAPPRSLPLPSLLYVFDLLLILYVFFFRPYLWMLCCSSGSLARFWLQFRRVLLCVAASMEPLLYVVYVVSFSLFRVWGLVGVHGRCGLFPDLLVSPWRWARCSKLFILSRACARSLVFPLSAQRWERFAWVSFAGVCGPACARLPAHGLSFRGDQLHADVPIAPLPHAASSLFPSLLGTKHNQSKAPATWAAVLLCAFSVSFLSA